MLATLATTPATWQSICAALYAIVVATYVPMQRFKRASNACTIKHGYTHSHTHTHTDTYIRSIVKLENWKTGNNNSNKKKEKYRETALIFWLAPFALLLLLLFGIAVVAIAVAVAVAVHQMHTKFLQILKNSQNTT